MLRYFIIMSLAIVVAAGAVAYALFQRSWIPYYWEAEPLHKVAAQFGQALHDSLDEEHRLDQMLWMDIMTLLKEDRFASLRDKGFVPSSDAKVLITIRLNDRFEAPIQKDGYTGLLRR